MILRARAIVGGGCSVWFGLLCMGGCGWGFWLWVCLEAAAVMFVGIGMRILDWFSDWVESVRARALVYGSGCIRFAHDSIQNADNLRRTEFAPLLALKACF